MLYIEHGLVTT